jgi:hypothetical protein
MVTITCTICLCTKSSQAVETSHWPREGRQSAALDTKPRYVQSNAAWHRRRAACRLRTIGRVRPKGRADREASLTPVCCVTEFRNPEAQIAKAESNILIFRVELGKEPGAIGIGREEFDDRKRSWRPLRLIRPFSSIFRRYPSVISSGDGQSFC